MSKPLDNETPGQYVMRLLDMGESRAQIEQYLLDQGHDLTFIKELIEATATLRNARRRTLGLSLILAGGIVCFLSFLLTITGVFSGTDGHGFALFGLTSIGVIIAFVGFTYVF
jgi:hypothetical protein